MKNTFKYIATLVAFSAATLASGIIVTAQNLPDGTYKEENGIAFAKRAHVNDNGTYTIDLESFVTGEVTQTFESVPADVVLVLDVSGSMSDGINSYTYNTATRTNLNAGNGGWDNNQKSTNYYYLYNGTYYRVYIGRARNGGYSQTYHYFLFFTVGGTRYHINSNGQVVSQEPTNVTSNNTNLWSTNLTLYTRTSSSTGVTKLQALKTAVGAFIDEINKNDRIDPETDQERDERLGNRIAIVAFSGANYAGQSTHNNSIKLNTGWVELGEDKDIDDSTGYDMLIDDVDDLSAGGGTHVEYGMQDALALIQNSSADVRTVVLFTDGIPGTGTWGVTETTNSANGAIDYSRQINAITIGTGENATTPKIYAVGLFDEKPLSGEDTYNYMNYVSSNYPSARNMTTPGTKDSDKFYMDASGGSAEDLVEIFTSIAESSGGSGNAQVSGGSTMTVDIVSSSFSVPKGFEDNPGGAITVLVAPCNGKTTIDGKEYFTFGTAKAPNEYGFSINPSISEADNKVSTTGFDYSENWCGPDPTSSTGWHGYKQIIRFVITVNDDAVGGPNVATNNSDSGIYLEGSDEPLVKFNRPTVKLPVQIWLQKQGLRPGDSAVLTLYKSPFVENFNPETATWENFTKVVVSYEDMYKEVDEQGNPTGLVKIVGLDPDYFYKLKEDAWAFGYTYQDGGIQYTVGDNVQNPFVFVNVPKPVKYDEASLRNVFKEKKAAADSGSESSE